MDAWPSTEAASSTTHHPLPECIPMAAHASCPSYATIALLMRVVHVVLAAAVQYGNGGSAVAVWHWWWQCFAAQVTRAPVK